MAYNGGQIKVGGVKLKLNVPAGRKATPQGTASFTQLGYNQTAKTVYDVTVPVNAGLFEPYAAPALSADVTYSFAGATATSRAVPSATVLNTLNPQEPIPVKVTVKNENPGPAQASISLDVPAGWSVEPKATPLDFAAKGETKSVAFTVKAVEGRGCDRPPPPLREIPRENRSDSSQIR